MVEQDAMFCNLEASLRIVPAGDISRLPVIHMYFQSSL